MTGAHRQCPDLRPEPADMTEVELANEARWRITQIDEQTDRMRKLFNDIGKSYEMSLALVNLEQAAMWAKRHMTK